jgi:hypothetical protein
MSEMDEAREVLAALLAAHRLYGEDGDDVFECGCGAKSPVEALEEDFGEQVWHERHVAELLAARVADAAAAAWDQGMRTGSSRAMRHMSDEPDLPLASAVDNPYRAALAPPVDHAHAADGTEVGA